MKRFVDLALASVLLCVLMPLLLTVAIISTCCSHGRILFRQKRVGLDGKIFEVIKFRTMDGSVAGPSVTGTNDARVTNWGRVLRRWKLDELPQLWNVIHGEMSLVGPRPEIPEMVAHWPREVRELVLSVRPGITDPASIAFRNEEAFLDPLSPEQSYVDRVLPVKLAMYEQYVNSRSMSGDVMILFRTFGAILRTSTGTSTRPV